MTSVVLWQDLICEFIWSVQIHREVGTTPKSEKRVSGVGNFVSPTFMRAFYNCILCVAWKKVYRIALIMKSAAIVLIVRWIEKIICDVAIDISVQCFGLMNVGHINICKGTRFSWKHDGKLCIFLNMNIGSTSCWYQHGIIFSVQ